EPVNSRKAEPCSRHYPTGLFFMVLLAGVSTSRPDEQFYQCPFSKLPDSTEPEQNTTGPGCARRGAGLWPRAQSAAPPSMGRTQAPDSGNVNIYCPETEFH